MAHNGSPAAGTAPLDALQYAETLRKDLMQDLFDGGGDEGAEMPADDEEDGDFSIEVGNAGAVSLADLDKQIEEYQEHEIIKAILERGMVIKEYATDVDNKLRQVELESIQDYIQESDNLVGLHEQVRGGEQRRKRRAARPAGEGAGPTHAHAHVHAPSQRV
jgi:hypothetical protein